MNWLTCHEKLLQLAKTNKVLTPSQISASDAVLNAVRRWEECVNLWGKPGTGKTFLAHSLHHNSELVYFSHPTRYEAEGSDSVVVIDNSPHDWQVARRLCDKIRWIEKDYTGPKTVVLITRQPIDDTVPRIELTLTDADIAHMETFIRQQFGEYNFETQSPYAQQRSGLWRYVKTLAQRAP